MSYTPPTLSDLIKQSLADFSDVTSQTLLVEAVSNSVAAQAYGLYEYIEYLSRQIVPHLADEEYLLKFCNFWGVWRKSATSATGYLKVKTTGDADLPLGISWKNSRGIIIESISSMTTTAGEFLIKVQAVDIGASSNCNEGEEFEIISPVANVETKAILSTNGLTGGADIESVDSLRSRLLFRVQHPPSGGTKFDYERWALECSGVTRAWCIPAPVYTNSVTVMFVLDEQPNIIPSDSDLDRVQEHIEGHVNEITNQWEGKPPAVELIMKAPEVKQVNPKIKVYPDTPEIREGINEALTHLFYGLDVGDTVYLSQIRATVSNVSGVIDNQVIYPETDVTTSYKEIAIFGNILWQ